MTLHIFVDLTKEVLVGAFRGDNVEAKRFMIHCSKQQEHHVWHIRVEDGSIKMADAEGVVAK